MSESEQQAAKRKRATFGVVFLTIFLDMVGFSVRYPPPQKLTKYIGEASIWSWGTTTSDPLNNNSVQGVGYSYLPTFGAKYSIWWIPQCLKLQRVPLHSTNQQSSL